MTRARDELYLCGRAGSEKRQPVPPKGFMRDLVAAGSSALKGAIQLRLLAAPQITQLQAAAGPLLTVSEWTQLPPRDQSRLLELSASALQSYEGCPLRYKLRYDWRLPEDASAAPQFGNAMHLALKAYFDGVRAGRPPDDATVLACFLDEFAKASIPEPLQRELYEARGRERLAAFLHSDLARPSGRILDTEKRFVVEIGGVRVRGRFDRIDALADGTVAVVDYKTGRPKTQDEADDSLAAFHLCAGGAGAGAHGFRTGVHQHGKRDGDRVPALREAVARCGGRGARDRGEDCGRGIRGETRHGMRVVLVPQHLSGEGGAAAAAGR